MSIPVSKVKWIPSYRIVSSRFPPAGLFDAVADPDDLEAVFYVEGLTNPRLRAQISNLSLIPKDRWISGHGTTPIMSAFSHLNPEGSRFSPGNFGVYYAARERDTAVAETVYHQERFLRHTNEPAFWLEMRCYAADVHGSLHDIRGGWPELHDPDSYVASQRTAVELRQSGSDGIVYDSVRAPGGQCVAVFYPDRISPAQPIEGYYYHWDGEAITHATVISGVVKFPRR